MIHFTLYSRSYCHLCDDMLKALRELCSGQAFSIDVIDIDKDDSLIAQYDELVPVLFGNKDDGLEIRLCHYFLDRSKLEFFLGLPQSTD